MAVSREIGTDSCVTAFVLFEEPQSAQPFHIPGGAKEYGAALEERRSWDAMEFAARYGLKLVGVNFFHVRAE